MWRAVGCVAVMGLVAAGLAVSSEPRNEPEKRPAEQSTPADEESPWIRATKRPADSGSVPTYTNADLSRLARGEPAGSAEEASPRSEPADPTSPEPARPESADEPPKSALDQLFEREEQRKEHAQQVAAAEQRVSSLSDKIKTMEKRLLAVRNPFLARPEAPEDDPDQWNGSTATERVAQTKDQLQAARDELAQAERELDELRRSAP